MSVTGQITGHACDEETWKGPWLAPGPRLTIFKAFFLPVLKGCYGFTRD